MSNESLDVLLGESFVWVGQRALDCIGLHRFLRFCGIICCDHGLDTEQVSSVIGGPIVSLEALLGQRRRWSNFSLDLLFGGDLEPTISDVLESGEDPINVLAYCSTQRLEEFVTRSKREIRILAASVSLKQKLDDKVVFRRVLSNMGIEPVPGCIVRPQCTDFDDLRTKLDIPFVIQFAKGASGSGTFVVRNRQDYQGLPVEDASVEIIASRLIRGPSPNINAVVSDDAVLLSSPSVQLIGVEECTNSSTAYCGNDFSATQLLPTAALDVIYHQTRLIGDWLRCEGFRGIFGVDFVTDCERVYPVEINPRFQGSTQLLSQLQIQRGDLPLGMAHISCFLGARRVEPSISSRDYQKPLAGSQIVLHNRNLLRCTVGGLLQPGVYVLRNDIPKRQRTGLSLLDCASEDEFVITCAVPYPKTTVEPEAPLLKIQTYRSVIDIETGSLRPWASSICRWAEAELRLA